MQIPKPPSNEVERIYYLRALKVLDSAPESRFDNITALASSVFNCPVSLISLVDEDRQWFKSRVGLDAEQTSRDVSFCAHVVEKGEPLIITDSRQNDLTQGNPLTLDHEKPVIFYAGAPLVTNSGLILGSLCVIDHQPRQFNDEQMRNLIRMAALVMDEFELRTLLAQSRQAKLKLAAKSHQLKERNAKLFDLLERFKSTRNRLIHAEKLATLGLIAAGVSQEASQSINSVRKCLMDAHSLLTDQPDKKAAGLISQGMDTLDHVRRLNDGLCDTTETAHSNELVLTDLNETINHARNVLLSRFDDKVRFLFTENAQLPRVKVVESQIFIALLNILMNAAESTRRQVSIRVKTDVREGLVILRVIDNGEGMSADILERITEPFFSFQRDSRHQGMGLAIAHGIIRDHNGGLKIQSEQGRGTQVTIGLPYSEQREV